MPKLPTVCVIGAGSSGMVAAKTLHTRGFEFDCFEKSDSVGGNWVFGNANQMSSAYTTLHINTSRERMEYADFPMPKDIPDFPHHTHIARYFDSYVDHFGFRDRISFQAGVQRAQRREGKRSAPGGTAGGRDRNGVWEVSTSRGDTNLYDALIVANGHHWDARWPEPAFPGSDTFEGEQIHAHDYTDPKQLEGKDVVVLGMGNSAMDIAVDASYAGQSTYLAARRGAHVVPKYFFGKPMDQIGASPRIPFAIRQRVFEGMMKTIVGPMTKYGLPEPDHRFGQAHPTVSGRILDRLVHGAITAKPNIARLEGDQVHFTDGTSVHADIVVYCTGYKVTFPFFEADFISAPDNDLPLFRRVFHPELPDVFFIGLLQPLGAIMPLADMQSQWVADYLGGRYHLPPKAQLRHDMERERERMFKRYVASKRHTMQVDFEDYIVALEKERKRGAARAGAAGNALPVPPRARARRGAAAGGRVSDLPVARPEAETVGRVSDLPVARPEAETVGRVSDLPVARPKAETVIETGRREATKAANRAQLLDAAREAFSELGFGATSVRDIVRGTDLASGTFYNYFPDKESIFRALVDEFTDEARARVRAARAAARTIRTFVEDSYRAYFEFIVEDPDTFAFVARNSGTIRHVFGEGALGAGAEELREDLEAAIEAGHIPPVDVDYCSHTMMAVGAELGMRLIERRPPDVDGATRFATELFMGGLARLSPGPRVA